MGHGDRQKHHVSLKAIAARTGVSVATVSRVLRAGDTSRSPSRDRILAAARELGYRPNLLVKGLQTGRTQAVGVVFPDMGEFSSRLFTGLYHVLNAADYLPIVVVSAEDEEHGLNRLIDRRVDGVILRAHRDAMYGSQLKQVLARKIPLVTVDTQVQGVESAVDFFGVDDLEGGCLAARHLLELGHRRLAVISTGDLPKPTHWRRIGFEGETCQTHMASCVSVNVEWRAELDVQAEARELLSMVPRPTGVFVTMDALASGVYRAAQDLGLRIPHDLSVIGFADVSVARHLIPGLTTLSQNPARIGRCAAARLLERIRDDGAARAAECLRFVPELVVRGSTASAPTTASP